MSTYYYGLNHSDRFKFDDLDEFLKSYFDLFLDNDGDIIVEMKTSRDEERFCQWYDCFLEKGDCSYDCEYYSPRNGKSGICHNMSYGLIKTGRAWKNINGKIIKISSRSK